MGLRRIMVGLTGAKAFFFYYPLSSFYSVWSRSHFYSPCRLCWYWWWWRWCCRKFTKISAWMTFRKARKKKREDFLKRPVMITKHVNESYIVFRQIDKKVKSPLVNASDFLASYVRAHKSTKKGKRREQAKKSSNYLNSSFANIMSSNIILYTNVYVCIYPLNALHIQETNEIFQSCWKTPTQHGNAPKC